MSGPKRYGTSVLGAVVHTIAGLAAIASVFLLVAVASYLAPEFLGDLGLDALVSGGTLAENVEGFAADTGITLPVLVAALVVSVALAVGGTRAGHVLYDVGRPAGGSTGTATAQGEQTGDDRPPEVAALESFGQLNLWIGGLLVAFIVITLALRGVVSGGGPLAAVAGFLWFAVQVFGGPGVLVAGAAVFLGVWYGLEQEAREALLVGVGAWGLVGLLGLGTISRSGSGVGLLIAAAYGVYYGVRAYPATESVTGGGRPARPRTAEGRTGAGPRGPQQQAREGVDESSGSSGEGGAGEAGGTRSETASDP